MRLADENGLGPNNVSGKLQARIELYGRAVERAAIRAQQQLSSAPTTQPAPAKATAPSYDTLQLYKDLQDLWAEANAVDTVIGRPEVLMAKITRMRDAVGQITATYLPEPKQEAQEPFAFHVCSLNSDGSLSLEHAAAWEEAAHEHINDAITEHDIEGAGSWVVRPAYHAPQPAPASQGDALDAARYRYLTRSMGDYCITHAVDLGGVLKAAAADAAIDAARAAHQEGEAP